jgi:hypothetical protein
MLILGSSLQESVIAKPEGLKQSPSLRKAVIASKVKQSAHATSAKDPATRKSAEYHRKKLEPWQM